MYVYLPERNKNVIRASGRKSGRGSFAFAMAYATHREKGIIRPAGAAVSRPSRQILFQIQRFRLQKRFSLFIRQSQAFSRFHYFFRNSCYFITERSCFTRNPLACGVKGTSLWHSDYSSIPFELTFCRKIDLNERNKIFIFASP